VANVKQIEWVTPAVMTGTGREVMEQLRRSPTRRTVAVSLLDNEQGVAAEIVFQRVAAFLPRLMEQNQQDNLKKIVSALLPDVAPSEAAMAQARMLIDAKSTILKGGDFIPAGEVSKLAGYSRTNPSVQPNKWKRNRAIFAIEHKGDDFFPLYALDPDDNYRPRKAVSEILGIFGDSKDGWGLAFWFAGLNSFLDDERPQDLLAAAPERVLAAARDEMAGVEHG
jgi:hypothetical protein